MTTTSADTSAITRADTSADTGVGTATPCRAGAEFACIGATDRPGTPETAPAATPTSPKGQR